MAKRRKQRNIFLISGIIVAVGAVGLYFWSQAQQRRRKEELLAMLQQRNIPSQPKNNTPEAIAAWVATLSSVYGNVKVLWEPGGPFYKKPPTNAQAVLDVLAKYPPGTLPV